MFEISLELKLDKSGCKGTKKNREIAVSVLYPCVKKKD